MQSVMKTLECGQYMLMISAQEKEINARMLKMSLLLF